MPRKRSRFPEYRYHISGQARVYLDGRYFYLGPHDSPKSYARYRALLAQYSSNGQRMPEEVPSHQQDAPITVRCVTAEFREHAKVKYANSPTREGYYRNLCTLLEDEHGDLPVDQFGPRKLAGLRDLFVASGNCRRYVNDQVRSVVAIFKYGVSRELVTPESLVALNSLEPLRYGQTPAREAEPVKPVDIEAVRLTAKHLSPPLKAMVRILGAYVDAKVLLDEANRVLK